MPRRRTFSLAGLSALVLALLVLLPGAHAEAQTFRTDDPVLRQMWEEGMEASRARALAQVLMDSVGPRLSGSPGYDAAADWLMGVYREWGIEVRQEEYGTWQGWREGVLHVDLVQPRVQTLEANLLAWSPGTDGAVEADVVMIPDAATPAEMEAWLPSVRGRIVLASPMEPTCREPQTLERLARPETVARIAAERDALRSTWAQRLRLLGAEPHQRLEEAGALVVLTSRWSEGWGVNKIFGASTYRAASIDLSCEDYGLVYRLVENGQGPALRVSADAEDLGTVPMYNVMAEIPGSELPDEYVMLSAHLDSWHGATGATDNGTGTITMLEAMRILRAAYPNPRRTILVGHWGGEEQGLIGSRAFAEDNPDVVENLQVLFNQDNGTWRIDYIQAQGLLGASANLAHWIAQLPTEISEHIELDVPGPQEVGGSDHVAFLCYGAPGWRLQSHYPEYRQYTWHTNRDTFDKIVIDDLMNNATLAAMLIYLASEDPERVPRDRSVLPLNPRTGEPREWLSCGAPRRTPSR
jgi:carboxypeptidase Q